MSDGEFSQLKFKRTQQKPFNVILSSFTGKCTLRLLDNKENEIGELKEENGKMLISAENV